MPELDRAGQYARFTEHLRRKYGEGGYLRLWLPDPAKQRRLKELRTMMRDEELLRRRFDALYEAERP